MVKKKILRKLTCSDCSPTDVRTVSDRCPTVSEKKIGSPKLKKNVLRPFSENSEIEIKRKIVFRKFGEQSI